MDYPSMYDEIGPLETPPTRSCCSPVLWEIIEKQPALTDPKNPVPEFTLTLSACRENWISKNNPKSTLEYEKSRILDFLATRATVKTLKFTWNPSHEYAWTRDCLIAVSKNPHVQTICLNFFTDSLLAGAEADMLRHMGSKRVCLQIWNFTTDEGASSYEFQQRTNRIVTSIVSVANLAELDVVWDTPAFVSALFQGLSQKEGLSSSLKILKLTSLHPAGTPIQALGAFLATKASSGLQNLRIFNVDLGSGDATEFCFGLSMAQSLTSLHILYIQRMSEVAQTNLGNCIASLPCLETIEINGDQNPDGLTLSSSLLEGLGSNISLKDITLTCTNVDSLDMEGLLLNAQSLEALRLYQPDPGDDHFEWVEDLAKGVRANNTLKCLELRVVQQGFELMPLLPAVSPPSPHTPFMLKELILRGHIQAQSLCSLLEVADLRLTRLTVDGLHMKLEDWDAIKSALKGATSLQYIHFSDKSNCNANGAMAKLFANLKICEIHYRLDLRVDRLAIAEGFLLHLKENQAVESAKLSFRPDPTLFCRDPVWRSYWYLFERKVKWVCFKNFVGNRIRPLGLNYQEIVANTIEEIQSKYPWSKAGKGLDLACFRYIAESLLRTEPPVVVDFVRHVVA